MISTRDLSRFPDIEKLRHSLQAMAMLDAILSPEWEDRYYSFNSKWGEGKQLGSMRNGSGDEFYAHFSSSGCWIKGFAHESPMTPYRHHPPRPWPGVLDPVPIEFSECLTEPAFSMQSVTFCIWRRPQDKGWSTGAVKFPDGPDPDGSEFLLSEVDGNPSTYLAFAADYYGKKLPLSAIEHVFAHRPLTRDLVQSLNPEISLSDLQDDVSEIGYPRSA